MSYFWKRQTYTMSILLVCRFFMKPVFWSWCLAPLPWQRKSSTNKLSISCKMTIYTNVHMYFIQYLWSFISCFCIYVVMIWVKANNILLHSSFNLFALFLLLYPNKLITGFTQKPTSFVRSFSPPLLPFGTWGFAQKKNILCTCVSGAFIPCGLGFKSRFPVP